jgi:hypothetical protein
MKLSDRETRSGFGYSLLLRFFGFLHRVCSMVGWRKSSDRHTTLGKGMAEHSYRVGLGPKGLVLTGQPVATKMLESP